MVLNIGYRDHDDNLNESTAFDPLDDNLLSLTPFKHNKFKVKSSWRGPVGPTNLEAFIASNERDYNHRPNYTPPSKQNLSTLERKALKLLKQDTSIVIKPADKGTTVVVMNRLDYLTEGYKQLGDDKYYRLVDEDLTNKHMN